MQVEKKSVRQFCQKRIVFTHIVSLLIVSCGGTTSSTVSQSGSTNKEASALGAALEISAKELDFGTVDCASEPVPQTFTIKNNALSALSWRADIEKSQAVYTLEPSNGALQAGESVVLAVKSTKITRPTAINADALADRIIISNNLPGQLSQYVSIRRMPKGAVIGFETSQVNFGRVALKSTSVQAIEVRNSGNSDATVSVAVNNTLFSLDKSTVVVPAGSKATFNATFAPGESVALQSGNITVSSSPDSVLCADLPAGLGIVASGADNGVNFTPGALDFGLVNCGSATNAKTLTFTNTGKSNYTLTAATLKRGLGSPFSINLPANKTVAPGSSLEIAVVPKAIPNSSAVPGDYRDTLVVTTDVPGDNPHEINIDEGARGAILSLSARSWTFTSAARNAQSSYELGILNSGNAPAKVRFDSITQPVFTFDQDVNVAANTTVVSKSYFTPTNTQTYNGTAQMVVSNDTVMCNFFLNDITMTGTGTAAANPTVTPTALNWGRVNCGAVATGKTVTINNPTVQPLPWNASITLFPSQYTLSASSGTVPPNSSTTITVTPVAIPVSNSTSVGAGYYNGTLEVVTRGQTDILTSIALSETAQGVVLSFSAASVRVSADNTVGFDINNTGNIPTTASLTMTKTNVDPLNPVQLSLFWGSGRTESGTPFRSGIIRTGNTKGTATVSVSSSDPLCVPLPPALLVYANP